MRNWFYICIFFVLSTSCSQKVQKQDLQQLSGYWEIKEVVFSDGTKKDYPVNLTVDFFQVDGLSGFRKKMKPEIDGTFSTSNTAQKFTIREQNGVFSIYYVNGLDEWSEKLIGISKESLIIENNEGMQYVYTKYHSLNLNP